MNNSIMFSNHSIFNAYREYDTWLNTHTSSLIIISTCSGKADAYYYIIVTYKTT